VKLYDDYLRFLYRSGRPNWWAKLQNGWSAFLFSRGIWPSRAAALEVKGRNSGKIISFPVVIAEIDGERYLVSMLGDDVNWVHNLRADDMRAVLKHGKAEDVRLVEVPVDERAPLIKRYLDLAPGGRPHIPVDRKEPVEAFEAVAADYPVFRIAPRDTRAG
jgi:hypothetical protein